MEFIGTPMTLCWCQLLHLLSSFCFWLVVTQKNMDLVHAIFCLVLVHLISTLYTHSSCVSGMSRLFQHGFSQCICLPCLLPFHLHMTLAWDIYFSHSLKTLSTMARKACSNLRKLVTLNLQHFLSFSLTNAMILTVTDRKKPQYICWIPLDSIFYLN